jgi:hypothetical protein
MIVTWLEGDRDRLSGRTYSCYLNTDGNRLQPSSADLFSAVLASPKFTQSLIIHCREAYERFTLLNWSKHCAREPESLSAQHGQPYVLKLGGTSEFQSFWRVQPAIVLLAVSGVRKARDSTYLGTYGVCCGKVLPQNVRC